MPSARLLGLKLSLLSLATLTTLTLISVGCDGLKGGDPSLSPWAVSDWVMGRALSAQGAEASLFGPHLSQEAGAALKDLHTTAHPTRPFGLLTLNKQEGERWAGRYGYVRDGWPLSVAFELRRAQGVWQVSEAPFSKVYVRLTSLLEPQGLPEVEVGERWEGGLIGFDQSGRPQGEVVLSWVPPYAFIDGTPLFGKASDHKVIESLAHAFRRRALMAAEAQASYLKRVTLAMSKESSVDEVIKLIGWLEDAGAESVSLLARNPRGEARLVRLAQRGSRLATLRDQRLAYAYVDDQVARFVGPQELTEQGRRRVPSPQEARVRHTEGRDEGEALNQLVELYRALQAQDQRLEGVVLNVDQGVTLQSLLRVVSTLRGVSDDLPFTLISAPQGPSKEPTSKEPAL